MEENKILIGTKPKKEWEPMFGRGQVILMMWIEDNQIRVWKKEPFRHKCSMQHSGNFLV